MCQGTTQYTGSVSGHTYSATAWYTGSVSLHDTVYRECVMTQCKCVRTHTRCHDTVYGECVSTHIQCHDTVYGECVRTKKQCHDTVYWDYVRTQTLCHDTVYRECVRTDRVSRHSIVGVCQDTHGVSRRVIGHKCQVIGKACVCTAFNELIKKNNTTVELSEVNTSYTCVINNFLLLINSF